MAIVGGLFVILLGQIVLRTFGAALVWVEEFSIAAFIWLSFLGIAMGYRHGGHMAIELFADMAEPFLPPRAVALWRLALEVLSFLFFAAFAYGLVVMANHSWGVFAGSIPGFRQAYIYLGVLAATLICLWELVRRIAVAWRGFVDAGRGEGGAP